MSLRRHRFTDDTLLVTARGGSRDMPLSKITLDDLEVRPRPEVIKALNDDIDRLYRGLQNELIGNDIRNTSAPVNTGGSSVTVLNDLDDVVNSSPANKHFLVNDGTNYVNRTIGLTDLTDGSGVVLTDGTAPLIAPWPAGDRIDVTELRIDATSDHRIFNSSDNLIFQNQNSDGDIVLRINDGGVTHDLVSIDASNPNIIIESTGGAATLAGDGIIDIKGSWGRGGAYGLMRFQPTITSTGASIGMFMDPEYDGPTTGQFGFAYRATVASGQAVTTTAFECQPGTASSGNNTTHTGFDDNFSRLMLNGDTLTLTGLQVGAIATSINASATINDTHISLVGGASAVLGTVNQYGIRFQGYSLSSGSGSHYAIHSNGGTVAWAADNAEFRMGAGEDTRMYYDGTNYIIDPDVVGSGRVLIGATGDDDMRLNDIEIDGDLNHDGSNWGMFGTAPTTQQTVTGSRGGNAALANLLTALANYGAIVDSTTA